MDFFPVSKNRFFSLVLLWAGAFGVFFSAWSYGFAQNSPDPISWRAILRQPVEWYQHPEAVRIADNVLVYQHENGGWAKNIDMTAALTADDRRRIAAEKAQERTTIDNGATLTQLAFLARVYDATGIPRFKEAFFRGIDFLLEAQYPNGGWPQFYPIRPGYWQRITFNDGAMIGAMRLLRDVAHQQAPYGFVDQGRRAMAANAIEKGLDVVLKTQIAVNGTRTAWCAQHDEKDFSPRGGRSYEHPSISGSESVGIVRYLMGIDNPGPNVIAAVQDAVAWFNRSAIHGLRLERREDATLPRGFDRVVVEDPLAPPMWARFYEIESNRPIFSGRDGIVKYSLAEIEHERRIGYSWLGFYPRDLLTREYPAWQQRWAPERNVLENPANKSGGVQAADP